MARRVVELLKNCQEKQLEQKYRQKAMKFDKNEKNITP